MSAPMKWFTAPGLVALVISISMSASAQELTALVIEAAGKVAYKQNDSGPLTPVQINVTRLKMGDTLFTSSNSSAKLLIEGKASEGGESGQSTVEVSARAKIRLTELLNTGGSESVKIGVAQGQIISNVRRIDPNSERFEVETPTAVAAVRGTVYGTDVRWIGQANPLVKFNVTEGQVDVFSAADRTNLLSRLREGDTLDIEPDGGVIEGSLEPKSGAAPQGQGGTKGFGTSGSQRGDVGENDDTIGAPELDNEEGDDTGGGRN